MKGPLVSDPNRATLENPEGETLNIGEWISVDDTLRVLEGLGFAPHDLLDQYENFQAPHFSANRDIAEALWRFRDWDIVVTTWFDEIPPYAIERGVRDLPITIIEAIPSGQSAKAVKWVLTHDFHRKAP